MPYYIIEKKIESEERFYGDHFPSYLEKQENAFHYPKEQAEEIAEGLGDDWRVTVVN